MKIKRILIPLIILAVGLYGGYRFGRSSQPEKPAATKMEAPSNGGGGTVKKKRKIKYWQAPMDPTYIRDKPGKSPMGMDLIPVYEDEGGESDSGAIRIDPITVQDIGVKTEIIKKRPLSREIRTVGRVAYDEKRVEDVHTKIEGWVEKLYVDFLGEEVKKGAPLLSIYSPELVSTQEEYLLALKYRKSLAASPFSAVSEGADTLLSSTRKRLELFDITPRQIDEIEKSGKVRKDLVLHSPAHGVVIEKTVQEGMYVQPGKNLYTIADISDVWIYADIYEYELPWLKLGQSADMNLSYLPGKAFHGKIIFIYPFLDKKSRTVKVRMEFANPGWELKPDMYTNVTIRSKISDAALTVPTEAVLRTGERDLAILALGGGKFLPRQVRLGAEGEGYYQVLSGLSEGDRVVTSAQFLIDSESKLKEAIAKMLEAQKKKGSAMEEKTSPTSMKPMKMKMEGMSHTTVLSDPLRKQMDKILEGYLTLQKKLSTDTIEGVQPVTVEIATLAEKVKAEDTKQVLKSTTTAITAAAPELLSTDIQTVREGFKKLSRAVTEYVKTKDPAGGKAEGLKIFYCPMVKEEWLQKGTAVENPFFGKKMLTCGTPVNY
jgi:Cu(I)/Ag(I) efflux system membrane fusion protein